MRKIFSILALCGTVCSLHGELIWDRKGGWTTEPGDGLVIQSSDFAALELMNDARSEQEDGKFSSALAKYKTLCKQYKDSIFAPEAYYQTGKIREQKHQYRAAFRAFNTIIEKYPQYPGFMKVLHEQFELASLLKSGSRPYYFGVIPGFRDQKAAIEYYENIVRTAPYSELAPLALINISELALRDKKPANAIDALERLIDAYPDSEYTPGAYLKIARIYSDLVKSTKHDQGATQEAVHHYEDFLILYPTNENVPEAEAELDKAKTKLARSKMDIAKFFFQSRNNPKAAIIMYKEAITCFPNSPIAEEAMKEIEFIKNGGRPKRTPVDFLFGRYKRPKDEEWIAEATLDEIANEHFEDKSEAVFDHKNSSMQSFSDHDQGEVNTGFDMPEQELESDDNEILDEENTEKEISAQRIDNKEVTTKVDIQNIDEQSDVYSEPEIENEE